MHFIYAYIPLALVLPQCQALSIRAFPHAITQVSSGGVPTKCTDLEADLDAECWSALNLPEYLTGWNKTTPTCKDNSGDFDKCCKVEEPWANCFLRLASGVADACHHPVASNATCPIDVRVNTTHVDESAAPKARYILRTIQKIDDFFLFYSECRFHSIARERGEIHLRCSITRLPQPIPRIFHRFPRRAI